jgi:hypothetical protein
MDYSYQGILAYRELARSVVVLVASDARSSAPDRVRTTNSAMDVNAADPW